jgi:hypothetical protein
VFKNSGVKKVFVIAIAANVQENYENLRALWASLGLGELNRHFTIACDLKVANLLLGLMPHSSRHPCCWCTADKHSLHAVGRPRTLKLLQESLSDFQTIGGSRRSLARNFDNVVQPCLLRGPPTVDIVQLLPPPALHLLTGTVGTIFNGLQATWPDCQHWLSDCHVTQDPQHGGSFTGNASRILLRNTDRLAAMCPLSALPFVEAFRAFDRVVGSCFGNELAPRWKQNLAGFSDRFADLSISVTPKVHAVFHHVSEFCEHTGTGLGLWSEHTVESLHHDFQKLWCNYKVGSTNSQYPARLLSAVRAYNSRHL